MWWLNDPGIKALIVFGGFPTLYVGLWAFARLVVNKLPRRIIRDDP